MTTFNEQYWEDAPTFTDAEQDFLSAYQTECERYYADYLSQANPENPVSLFWTRAIDDELLSHLPEQYQDIVRGIDTRDDTYRNVVVFGVHAITDALGHAMRDSFARLVAQATLPTAPDPTKPVRVKYWTYEETYQDYQPAEVYGQIFFSYYLYRGERTYRFLILPFHNAYLFDMKIAGSRERKQVFHEKMQWLAQELSKLTDWSLVKELTYVQQTALKERINALKAKVTQ